MITDTHQTVSLISFFVILASIVMFSNHTYMSNTVMPVEECVASKWKEFEDRTQQMPSIELESVWRDQCWNELSAVKN